MAALLGPSAAIVVLTTVPLVGVAVNAALGAIKILTGVFGNSYALTLARWQARFQKAWPQIGALGFDERFKRTWEYYLAYCEAGFESGYLDVAQIRLGRP